MTTRWTSSACMRLPASSARSEPASSSIPPWAAPASSTTAKCAVENGAFTGVCGALDYDMVGQVIIQAKAVLMTIVWSGIGSLLVYIIIGVLVGLRVSEETEREGLDIVSHGERAYNL